MNLLTKAYYRTYQLAFKMAIPLLPYRKPNLLESVARLPHILKENKKTRVLIITDRFINELGLLEETKEVLGKNNIHFSIFDKTIPNPTIKNVEEARCVYLDSGSQAIIAIGGGSAIDLAKATGARIVRPNKSVSQMKGLLRIRKKLPLLVAIPTTAGTGSETTLATVITDSEINHKYPINDFSLIPHYAILDYKMTLNLPGMLTATTGMDALTHAIEAYIGRSTTNETRKMAKEAVKLIVQNIKTCYYEPHNKEARQNMLVASYYAGIAFTVSYVGYVHAVAHSIGGKYGSAHGLCNAVLLPVVLQKYGKCIYKKLAILAKYADIAQVGDTDEKASLKLIEWIIKANEEMNIPKVIADVKKEDISSMATYAYKEAHPLYPVPRLFNKKEIENIYMEVCS